MAVKLTGKRATVYIARDEDALRNGSFIVMADETRAKGSRFVNGDYVGWATVTNDRTSVRWFSRDEATAFLPKIFR